MPQTYETTIEAGAVEEKPQVTVEYCGTIPLMWRCQSYRVARMDLKTSFMPGEKITMDYDYARRIFGDWEVNPDDSPQKRIEWNGMIAHTKLKSPSNDNMLPKVKIYDPDGNLLWDAAEQMRLWLEHNSASPGAFAIPKGSPMGDVEMPKILKEATYDQLKALWLETFGSKMPAGTQAEVAKKALMPQLSASQIADVLAKEFATADAE